MNYFTVIFVYFILNLNVIKSNMIGFGPCQRPTNLPPEIKFSIKSYRNFDGQIKIPFAYIVTPKYPEEIVTLSNWAYQNGYRVRAMGSSHSWAPFQFALSESGSSCPKTILVDTVAHLTSMSVNPSDYGRPDLHSVTLGPGVKLSQLLTFLEKHDLGLYASPSIGEVTVGGLISGGAHGSGIPAKVDTKSTGHTYGTLSNLVMYMTIVAWNEENSSYQLKTLYRWDKDCKAFLTSLGRTFITSVTLRVGKNQNLRSLNHYFIPTSEYFAPPFGVTGSTRTLASFAEYYGRTESTGMPFGLFMWVTTWNAETEKPPQSRVVSEPFNHYLMDIFLMLGRLVEPVVRTVVNNVPVLPTLTSLFTNPMLYSGAMITRTIDYWGPSKNHLLYMTSLAPRSSASGFTILTSRSNLQLIISIIKSHHSRLSREFALKSKYPNIVDFEIRVSGVDDPKDVEIPGAESPSLSAGSLLSEYPDYDLILWIEGLGFPNAPGMNEFYTLLQNHVLEDVHQKLGILRFEWTKCWGFSRDGPWKNTSVLNDIVPRSFSTSDQFKEWNWAVEKITAYDPHRIFSNEFLDTLLVIK